ncbi:MAG: ABC transporter permease [Gemmatimonadaceae bacterium]
MKSLVRSLTKDRGLIAAAAGIMAVGMIAWTHAGSLVYATLLRQPPFDHAERIVMVYSTHTPYGQARTIARWSYPRIQLVRKLARSFTDVANYTPTQLALTGQLEAEPIAGEFTSASYFAVLHIGAALGRVYAGNEDVAAGGNPVVVIAHDLWLRRYGADPGIIGRVIGVNRHQLTVVGVMPPGFRGLSDKAQVWLPATMAPVLTYPDYLVTDQNFVSMVARVRPGVTLDAVNAELATLGPQVFRAIPETEPTPLNQPSAVAKPLNAARVHPSVRDAVLMFAFAVAVLQLLACVNVTSLLLGRAEARRREAAVRRALGGTTSALVAHYFTDDVVPVAAGGLVGVLVALLGGGALGAPADVWGPANFYGSLAAFSMPARRDRRRVRDRVGPAYGGWRRVATGVAHRQVRRWGRPARRRPRCVLRGGHASTTPRAWSDRCN